MFAGSAWAQTIDAVHSYDIRPGNLVQTINSISQRSGVQVVYDIDLLKGKQATVVEGALSLRQALDTALAGTGLTYQLVNETTVVIRKVDAKSTKPAVPVKRKSEATEGTSQQPAPKELEEVVVTGSRLSRASIEGPVPVNVYTHEDIVRSGQANVTDFLNTLPEVSVGSPESGPGYAGQTTVRLRGLPFSTTLVLLNGRRLESGGGTAGQGGYFDLNNIPTGVIERIEIVPEGSSAIYGSDALAGVVNIILKKDFDGFQADMNYGAASGTNEASTDLAWGKVWDRGSLSLVGTYYSRSALLGTERKNSSSTTIGGSLTERCNPGNVYSVDGGNLPGLSTPSAGIKAGVHDAPDVADFNAGLLNVCRDGSGSGAETFLIPSARRATVFASGSYAVSPKVELFTELMYTHQEQNNFYGHRGLSNTVVPASNAYNPFGEDVRVNYQFSAKSAEWRDESKSDFNRALVGARGHFTDAWDWELSAWQSSDKLNLTSIGSLTDQAKRAMALSSSDPATALNLFTTGSPASDDILHSIFLPGMKRYVGKSRVANGFVRGSLFELPAGPVSIVLGGEYVHTDLSWESSTDASASANFFHQRNSDSLFSEVRIPILANKHNPEAGDVLAFTGALRYERDEFFGGHLTRQFAMEWRPAESLLLRGSYAEAFKAPVLFNLNYPTISFPNICCVIDPKNGGVAVPYIYTYAGNKNLDPETGTSRSVGLVWSPRAMAGFEASLTAWQISQFGSATLLGSQTIVDNESLFPGRVVRDPATNAIQSVSLGFLNFGELHVAGVDLGLSYRIPTKMGTFTPSIRASEMYRYDAGVAPGAPVTDRLGKATRSGAWGPRWKGNVNLGWVSGPYSASLSGRYVSSYTDYQDFGPTSRKLGDFWYWDVFGKYEVGKALASSNRYLSGAFVRFGVVNLLNSSPKYSNYAYASRGYDPAQYDIRGRVVSAGVGIRF